jgi:quercetin dioxygenase-like cupin family protein
LVQTKDPVAEHTHADADETIYVVAGEGTHKVGGRDAAIEAGTFLVVPRGTPHSLRRSGSRPLIFVSTLSGPPCQAGK